MKSLTNGALRAAEAVAAAMMAAMFATFVIQILVRYSARVPVIAETFPLLAPSNFGWTLEFCLALWVWLVFWSCAFVVRESDHVTFDLLYFAVNPRLRMWFAVIAGLAIAIGLIASIAPTLDRFAILRLKKTATLSTVFGDWVRMRDIYAIYIVFLVAVAARYLWRAVDAVRNGVEEPAVHHAERRLDE